MEGAGHIKIDTSRGAVVTNINISDAVHERITKLKQKVEAKKAAEEAAEWVAAYKEPKAEIRRLIILAPQRAIQRKCLDRFCALKIYVRRVEANISRVWK